MEQLLKEISETLKRIEENTMFNRRILTFEQGCEYLGYAKSYVYKLTAAGILPFSKPNNKSIFFEREKLEAWMLSNANTSHEEKTIEAATYVTTN